MGCPPVVSRGELVNSVSARIEVFERKVIRLQGVIEIADNILREKFGISIEAKKCLIDALKKAEAESEWDEKSLRQDLTKRIEDLRADLLANYKSLLDGRQATISSDPSNASKIQVTKLDDQKRKEMSEAFEKKLDEKINAVLAEFQLDIDTDLEQLLLVLEANYRIEMEKYEGFFNVKEQMAMGENNLKEELEPTFMNLRKLKAQLLMDLKASDIFTACQVGDLPFLQDLINKKSRFSRKKFVNQTHEVGFTALHVACYHGHIGAAKILLNAGSSINVPDKYNYRPIHWVAKRGIFPMLKYLLEHKKIEINAEGEYGRTALHMAVFNGKIKSMRLLMNHGANINAQTNKDDQEQTPLHQAVISGNIPMVKALTEYPQLNVNIRDSQGHSSVHHAATDGFSEILELLLNHSSWSNPSEPTDENSIDYLLRASIKNREAVRLILLEKYPIKVEEIKQ